jgi:hypothetical protein
MEKPVFNHTADTLDDAFLGGEINKTILFEKMKKRIRAVYGNNSDNPDATLSEAIEIIYDDMDEEERGLILCFLLSKSIIDTTNHLDDLVNNLF